MATEKKSVFIVTSGSYDDYQIDEVFSTMEKAQAFVDIYDKASLLGDCGEKKQIDEFILDDIDVVEEGYEAKEYWQIFVYFDLDKHPSKRVSFVETYVSHKSCVTNSKEKYELLWTIYYNQKSGRINVTSYVSADHAVRLAADIARQLRTLLLLTVLPCNIHRLQDYVKVSDD